MLPDHSRSWPRSRTAAWLAAAFAGLLAFHLVLALRLPGPILYEDSLSYLAIARFLVEWGPRPLLLTPSFYHFGYSLLLAPLYPLLDSSWKVFRAALVLDSALASLQVVVLYALARRLFGLRRSVSWPAALAAALYPSWMLQSSFAWTESLFALVFSGYVLLAFQAVRRGTAGWLIAFACAGTFLYTVHPRGLGIVAVTFLFLLAWGIRKRFGPGATAAALLAAAGIFAVTRQVNQALMARLWVARPPASEGTFLGWVADPAMWAGVMPQRAAGQVWYLLAATLGLFALGVWELGRRAARPRPAEGRDIRDGRDGTAGAEAARVLLLSVAAVLAASVTVMIPAERSDHFVYGRYNEALLGPVLVAGLAMIATATNRQVMVRWAGAMGLCALLGAALPRLLPAEGLAQPPMVLNVLGILVWNPPGSLGLARSSLGAILAAGVLALLVLASRRVAVLALAVFFAVSAVVVAQRQLLPFCAYWRNVVTLQDTLRPLAPAAVSYERSGFAGIYGFHAYQFWLDGVRFQLFDAAAGQEPAEPLVIAPRSWKARPGDRQVAAEPLLDQILWVRSGPLQTDLGRRGWLIPADPGAPLPDAASRSRLGWPGGAGLVALQAGETASLRFRVEHAGREAPWLPFGAVSTLAGTPWGSVRLGGQWYREGEAAPIAFFPLRGELPRVVRPGEAVEVALEVAARDPAGAPLEPGSYVLEVALVQEGVRWFPQAGDASLRVPVEVRR